MSDQIIRTLFSYMKSWKEREKERRKNNFSHEKFIHFLDISENRDICASFNFQQITVSSAGNTLWKD